MLPEDVLGAPAAPSIDDDVDVLEGEEPETEVEVEAEEAKAEDAEEEEIDLEDEDKKPAIPFDRPTVKELREAFPDIFKKFPSLRDSYFREIEFTKLFPSVDDAKEAIQENDAFTTLSDAALEGDPAPLLESLDKTDKKAFALFSVGFLPALYKRDPDTYQQVITPVVESLFRNAYKSSDEAVRAAAVTIAKFVFDDDGELVAQGKKTFSRTTELTKDQERLKGERSERTAQQFREAYSTVSQRVTSGLEAMIIKDIDPNHAFSSFVRKQLAQETVKRIFKQLESDDGHKSVMSNRWKKAKSNGYTGEDTSKIVSTFLARAKSLIPSVSDKVRSLAAGKAVEPSKEQQSRREVNGGRPTNSRPSKTPTRTDMRKMTDMEILEM